MKKTHKIVMLPTEKANPSMCLAHNLGVCKSLVNKQTSSEHWKGQHLYIISDDEIKEGDWYYVPSIKAWGSQSIAQRTIETNEELIEYSCKKIVATTDKSLIIGGTEKWVYPQKLPKIPESFIQAYIKAYNEGKPITEVDLEGTESPTGGNRFMHDETEDYFILKTREDNTVIIHQSKMYSRDEVLDIIGKRDIHHFNNSIDKLNAQSPEQWMKSNNL